MSEPDAAARRRPYVTYSPILARRLVRRVADGESVAEVCADPDMPAAQTVSRWRRANPGFDRALSRAREMSDQWRRTSPDGEDVGFPRPATPEAEVIAREVVSRLAAGELMIQICADPLMPSRSTMYRWRRTWPEFGEAVLVAQRIRAEALCEEGWEMALAATPETARVTQLRLNYLKWLAGVMAPSYCGPRQTVAAEQPAPPPAPPAPRRRVVFVARRFETLKDANGKDYVREIPLEEQASPKFAPGPFLDD